MTNPLDPDRLSDALSGRAPAGQHEADLTAAVRVARHIEGIRLPDPPAGAGPALQARFTAFTQSQKEPKVRDRFLGWFGAGAAPRPLAQRFAAGALALSLIGSGASVAAGTTPFEVVGGTGTFLVNAARSLNPGDGQGSSEGSPGGAEPTPPAVATPAETREPGETQTPGSGTTSAGATPAPRTTVASGATPGASGTLPAGATASATAPPSRTPSSSPTAAGTATLSPSASPTRATATASPGTTVTPTASPSPSSTANPTPGAGLSTSTYSVGAVGSVTLAYGLGVVQVQSVSPAGGWTYTVEPEENGWKVDFRSGDQRIRFTALPGNPTPVTTIEDRSGGGDDS